jgi:hypothetical protein
MKKTLLFLVSLLMTMGAMAQTTVLWSEDFSSYSKGDVPTGGTYNYACVGSGTKIYEETTAGGEAPEILVGKSSGSFSATIPMNGVSGEVNLQYKANRSLTISAESATVGEISNTGNDYSCTLTVASGTTSVTITFGNSTSKNVRLDNIKFFTGTAKKAAGLSWGTASREVTMGADDNNFPTLSNSNNLSVTYTSSDPSVATIASDGTITLVAAGKTNITASFAGNDEYEAGEVTYALTVKEASTVDISNTPETAYSVAKAIELITANEGLDTKVYVKGKIASITEVSTKYGNATYTISDDGETTTTITVYHGYYIGSEKFTAEDQIKVGDEVIVYGKLVLYNSTNEINSGSSIYSINGSTTNISAITADSADADAPVYNLAGQRVGKNAKGVLIKNGKKYVVK